MTTAPRGEQVYATLLLSDSYLPGALVLAHSLRDAGTSKKLAVLVTLDSVSADSVSQLQAVYDYILPVPRIRNDHPANLYLMNRGDLHSAFTKINLWRQLQFSKVVYIDADIVALRAPDELFDVPHAFAAAPDIGWPDIFNSGVMVLTPNLTDYYALTAMADKGVSFDGADQGLLNMHFKNEYYRLSFSYNVTPSAHYQYVPAYRHFRSTINLVHFIGPHKPWFAGRGAEGQSPSDEMTNKWWSVYDRHYGSKARGRNEATPETQYVQYFTKGEWQPKSLDPAPADGEHSGTSHGDHHSSSSASPSSSHTHSQVTGVADAQETQRSSGYDVAMHTSRQAERPSERQQEGQQHGSGVSAPADHRNEHPNPVTSNSWDAQWHPPPTNSKPEAINFPNTHYTMSRDATPFVPPARYPSPPKDMWYKVPEQPPAAEAARPAAIFPWEGHQTKPSRTFPSAPKPSIQTKDFAQSNTAPSQGDPSTPLTPSIKVTPSDPWSSFPRLNAWDEVPEINRYVDGLQKHRRVKSQGSAGSPSLGEQIASPKGSGNRERRIGFKLTDFPTEVERPSLPVTPAPIHRTSYFSEEAEGQGHEDAEEKLPAAEGVPAQAEWDPVAQLQKLAKQQSDMLLRRLGQDEGESLASTRELPARSLPFGSEDAKPRTFIARSTPGPSGASARQGVVHSPRPVKGEATSSLLRDDPEARASGSRSGNASASGNSPFYGSTTR